VYESGPFPGILSLTREQGGIEVPLGAAPAFKRAHLTRVRQFDLERLVDHLVGVRA
jgi:hypothetical protein